MNPNYIAYARAHGRSPEEMLEHDRKQYSGGCMTGFILWISQCKQNFYLKSPQSFIGDRGHRQIIDLAAWEAYLQSISI